MGIGDTSGGDEAGMAAKPADPLVAVLYEALKAAPVREYLANVGPIYDDDTVSIDGQFDLGLVAQHIRREFFGVR